MNKESELSLAGCKIAFVDSFKYRGHIIQNDKPDDLHIT